MDDAVTERRNEANAELDLRSTAELVELINDEDATVAAAVRSAAEPLAEAIEAIVSRLARGGRLVYVGAGTSGRLAAVDAAECPATFGVEPGRVLALVAEQEALEDDLGRRAGRGRRRRNRRSRRGRRPVRERPHPLRPWSGRGRRRHGGSHGRRRVRARVAARRRCRAGDRGGRRARGDRGLHPDEGRHRAEARPEHDLDRGNDPARQDLREPDGGRRRRRTRSCAAVRAVPWSSRPARRRSTSTPRSRPPPATPRWRSSRCSPMSTPTRRERGSTESGGFVRRSLEQP